MLNPRLDDLIPYPFERLAALLADVAPPEGVEPIFMSLGEPRHAPPPILNTALADHAEEWGRYAPLRGTREFREAVSRWLTGRYGLPDGFIDPDANVLPVSGTREAIFMFGLVAIPTHRPGSGETPAVLVPNPLYHVYSGAAAMAGAETVFLPATAETGFLPDLSALDVRLLGRTVLAYLCSPANPQGTAMSKTALCEAAELALRHDFVLAVDECYSEIYYREPPCGILEAAAGFGAQAQAALERIVVFNSLSKRSGAPGLRSGFVAGGAGLIAAFAKLRNFASVQSPLPVIAAAGRLWGDEDHVTESRAAYREKLELAADLLGSRYGFYRPDGGFFLWLDVGDGEQAAVELWSRCAVRVLPGAYLCPAEKDLSRPGKPYIRLALVDEPATIAEALGRIRRVLN